MRPDYRLRVESWDGLVVGAYSVKQLALLERAGLLARNAKGDRCLVAGAGHEACRRFVYGGAAPAFARGAA